MTSDTRIEFATEARLDLDDIQQYTLERWGERQLERYQADLNNALERVRSFPEIGRVVEGSIREFPVAQHVLLYRYEGDTVIILRVIHPRRLRNR